MNLLSSYDRFCQVYPAQGSLALLRQSAFDYVNARGLPTRKNEDWHYTSVKLLNELTFMPSAFNTSGPSHQTIVEIKKILNPDFTNIVFFNGFLNEQLSNELPSGLTIQEHFDVPTIFQDSFDALNAAYLIKPFYLSLEKNTSVEKPVNFVFYTSVEGGPALMVHPQILLEVNSRSSLKVVESYYGKSGVSCFVNSVVDIRMAENSKLIYSRIQAESENAINFGRTRISMDKSSQLESLVLATGAGLSRHSLDVILKGAGASAEVLGVYATKKSQHVDNTTLIDHQVGHGNTNQLYKGILDGESRAVFNGKIIIQKNAQKANSAQLNNNLLLSSKAEADSKPNLEIYADDVKASHGSTVGQMNSEELFYLLSRAIPKFKAITMLSYGFLTEVIDRISDDDIRKWLGLHLDHAFAELQREITK